jgi:DNA-binding GntR family transcriptional regulator
MESATRSHGYRTVADLAYDQLRERILSGALEPGARIDQDAEAERLAASRMPVREALRRLESEGLVQILRHRGAIVRPLSITDLEDLYVLRIELEGAASRLGTERITDSQLDAMRELIAPMEAIVERRDVQAWLAIDWDFHAILYGAAGYQRLLSTIQSLREEAGRYRLIGFKQPRELEHSLKSHHTILAAVARRDGGAVEEVVQGEMIRSRTEMARVLGQLTPDGTAEGR